LCICTILIYFCALPQNVFCANAQKVKKEWDLEADTEEDMDTD